MEKGLKNSLVKWILIAQQQELWSMVRTSVCVWVFETENFVYITRETIETHSLQIQFNLTY